MANGRTQVLISNILRLGTAHLVLQPLLSLSLLQSQFEDDKLINVIHGNISCSQHVHSRLDLVILQSFRVLKFICDSRHITIHRQVAIMLIQIELISVVEERHRSFCIDLCIVETPVKGNTEEVMP